MDSKNQVQAYIQNRCEVRQRTPKNRAENEPNMRVSFNKNIEFQSDNDSIDALELSQSFKRLQKVGESSKQQHKREICKKKRIRRKSQCNSTKRFSKLHSHKISNNNPNLYINKIISSEQLHYQSCTNSIRLFRKKICLICRIKTSRLNQDLILCAACEDAYHPNCLLSSLKSTHQQIFNEWFCSECLKYNSYPSSDLITFSLLKNQSLFHNGQMYLKYMKDQIEMHISQKGYVKLDNLPEQYWTKPQSKRFGLKSFEPFENQIQYFESFARALVSARLVFYPFQLYKSRQVLQLNLSILNEPQVAQSLNTEDQSQFEKFLENISKGIAPPIRVQHCQTKGYFLQALEKIPAHTIICEYSGEVVTYREALRQFKNNSIFTLLQRGQANKTLVIVPNKFANISKYFLGINNNSREGYKKINVQSLLFSYKGRNRIIFYTLKKIQKEQALYIDYNAGLYDRYPTSEFIN